MGRLYKRLIAGFLAVGIILSNNVPTFAAESRVSTGGGGSGSFVGTLKEVFNVVVPTQPDMAVQNGVANRSIFDFLLDPRGLAQDGSLTGAKLEPGASVYFKNEEEGAPYDYSSTSDALKVINKSTAQVDVTLDAEIAGMDGIRLTSDEKFTNDPNASVFLALKDDNGKKVALDSYGAFLKTTLAGQPNAYNVVYTGKYEYEMKTADEIAAEGISFAEYSFRLTGVCNTANSWTKLTEPLNPNLTIIWKIALRPKNVAPTIGKLFYSMNKGKDVNIDIDLGSGKLAATGIKSITYTKSTGTAVLPLNDYSFANGILTIKASCISKIMSAGIMSRDYVVHFDDNANTQISIHLSASRLAPSIGATSYVMESGKPVIIDVDLGAGDLSATGIQSITYNKSSGPATLTADNYTFTGGRLTLSASYISILLKAGILSRDYVVTFNDKAGTSVGFTLGVDGTVPSIDVVSYTMRRGSDVAVGLDLGSGGLAATGIKSITYVKSSGTSVLSSDNYTFADGVLTIKKSCIETLLNVGIKSRDYTITFNNSIETKKTITLIADNIAPTIASNEYTMLHGKAVTVDVDLGSGNLGATAIQAIRYEKSSGIASLPTTNYSFTNGKLVFNASYISSLLSLGITARDYTIIFNDTASTSVTITMRADGSAPFIPSTSYEMSPGKDVAIDVDLGSGDLAATGVQSITYMKSTGEAVLASSNYVYAGGVLTIKGTCITTIMSAGVSSREYTVQFNDIAKTKAVVKLAVSGKAPSVSTKTYTMKAGEPVVVSVDLGSGGLAATGIRSITYQKSSGLTVLPSENYTYANGVLTIKASYISTVIKAGVSSRDYMITFNDLAKTHATINFKK